MGIAKGIEADRGSAAFSYGLELHVLSELPLQVVLVQFVTHMLGLNLSTQYIYDPPGIIVLP